MTTPSERRVNEHTSIGNMADGDKLLGERVDGTTVLITIDGVSRLANTSGTNTGDQTSIVGITGTKAEFDAAVTDGNILYVGDVTQYTDEMAQDAVGGMVDTTLVYTDGTPLLQRAALTGDVTASAGSNATTIANDAVTYAKMQNISATDRLLGRSTAGSGDVEEITCTAAGRAILDDADATAQRTTLGLVIGTDVQAYDSELAALAGLTSAADKFPYFTGSGTAALADVSSAMRTFLTTSSSANLRSLITDESGTGALLFAGGNIGAATATSINFGQDSLDQYDIGTWVPVFTLQTVGDLSVSYATQSGNFTRIGRIAYINFELICTPTFTTGSGEIRLTGLPFAPANSEGQGSIVTISSGFTWPAGRTMVAPTASSGNYLILRASGSAVGSTTLASTNIVSGAAITIVASVVYRI